MAALGFFGIGDTEMLVIMVAILIFFGGKRMPELAKGLGKALKELKRATNEVEQEFKRVMEEAENPPPAPLPPYTPAADALPAAPVVESLPAPAPVHDVQDLNPETRAHPEAAQEEAPKPAKPLWEDGEFHSDV